MTASYFVTITPPGRNGYVTIKADPGTQAVGSYSGNPLDATDPGPIELIVFDDRGIAVGLTFTDPVFAAAVRDGLDRAIKVADTRDYSQDRPNPDSPLFERQQAGKSPEQEQKCPGGDACIAR